MKNEEAKVLIESNLKEAKSEKKSLLLNELRRLGIFELVANSVTAIISGAVPSDAVKERLIAHGIVSGGAAMIDLIYALIDSKDEFENNRDKIMLLKGGKLCQLENLLKNHRCVVQQRKVMKKWCLLDARLLISLRNIFSLVGLPHVRNIGGQHCLFC